ncbi:MAG: ATP-binding cassette domain-containing protein [Acidobacteria bacterium]|nr:ATP-binding cassette domain-containing protein [Acidobacteriota bacterium]MBV9145518.1 ATP-binding cassette domain-containing protein [Acidobacteriota bacterium]
MSSSTTSPTGLAEAENKDEASHNSIEVQALRHQYGERVALDEVSFGVRSAEIFGLLGPNGSGKTTLFRILTTLMVPTSGQARIVGFDPVKQPNEVRRRIGVVAQAQSVDVKLTAAENLMHQGHLYGLSGTPLKRRIAEMLERVRLSDRANDLVETFSGGMQRRVELAKGLIHRPSVLLLDEPTTGLDPGARRDLWLYLDKLREQEGVTVLVTTHLMEEAERCDRLAILSHGKLVGLGTPAELKSRIGGDVIQFEAEHAETLATRIRQRFGVECSVNDNLVRLERSHGHRFAADVMEAFAGEIRAVNVSRPTLEDVFINRTGHRFWTEGRVEAEEPRR